MKPFDLKYIVNPVQYTAGMERPKFRSYYVASRFVEPEKMEKISKSVAGNYWYILTCEERKHMIDQGIRRLE